MANQIISKREKPRMNLCRRFLMAIVALVSLSNAQALAITFVKAITPNSSKTTGTSIALTIPAGGIAAGNSIIVSFDRK